MREYTGHRLLACLCVLLASATAAAQQVTTDPASTHIFPAGGRRGTTVQVRVGGECLPPQTRFRIAGEGIVAPPELGSRAAFRGEPSPRRKPGEQHINYPKEWNSEIQIAADAPPGPRHWWLSCARGGTGARTFLVGDLPEFIETESNSLPERAEPVGYLANPETTLSAVGVAMTATLARVGRRSVAAPSAVTAAMAI